MTGSVILHAKVPPKSAVGPEFSSPVPRLRISSRRRGLPIHIPIAILLTALSMSGKLRAQNGITAGQASAITTSAGTDSLWADTNDHRWKVNNDGTGPQDLAVWPCATAGVGGLVYGGAPNTHLIDPESCLSLLTTTPAGVPLLVGVVTPIAWGGTTGAGPVTSLDLQNWAEVTEAPNTATATHENVLAKFTASGGVTVATTTDIFTPTYAVVAGAGTTGNAQMAVAGQVSCFMDTNTSSVTGDLVVASTTTGMGGDCHVFNSGSLAPGTWVIGQMVSNMTTMGSLATVLVSPGFPLLTSSLSNIAGTKLATASSITTSAITEFSSAGDVVSSSLSDNGSIVSLGSESVVLNRTSVLNGTAGTLTVTPSMGGGASASVMVGTDQAVQISVLTGTAPSGTPSLVYRWGTNPWGSTNPVCISQVETAGNPPLPTINAATDVHVTVTFETTPAAGTTYLVNIICFGTS
jgi:hypothetical protein